MRDDEAPLAERSVGVAGAKKTTEPRPDLDGLNELVDVRLYGQSAYVEPGCLSSAQSAHARREASALIARVAFAAGRAQGFRDGHRAGRLDAYRYVGPRHLVDAIRRDLDALRQDISS